MSLHPLVKKVLITEDEIDKRVVELAKEINDYYLQNENMPKDNTLVCLGLLKGCIPFLAKLIKYFEIECITDYMVVSSFGGGVDRTSEPKIVLDLITPIKDCDILIVEDIIDTGVTLEKIKNYLYSKGAKSVKVVTLLDKKAGRVADISADWYGFDVPKEFLIGFGLDYEERLRNLPYVAVCDVEKLKTWKW